MKIYQNLLNKVLTEGEKNRTDRTSTGCRSLFGEQITINLKNGFPLLTTKNVHFKSVKIELLWFLRGSSNIKFMQDNDVTIWDEWADSKGNLGMTYGTQWRRWSGWYDQIKDVINGIKANPYSRRHIVNAWNVVDTQGMALPPCHVLFQFFVSLKNKLSCHLYMRSCDIFLGLPFNIASYALLTEMIAKECKLSVDKLVISFGDLHLYDNHIEQAELQLSREPMHLPTLDLDNFDMQDCLIDATTQVDNIKIKNYFSHGKIKAPIAI